MKNPEEQRDWPWPEELDALIAAPEHHKLLMENEQVQFYELCTITEEKGSLILRLKHFHSDLKGWEEKDETVDFKLVKVTPGKVFFDGFTFERISDNEINIYVVIEDGGEQQEVKFNYRKVGE